MLLLVPYHGLLFLQNSQEDMPGLGFSVFWLHLWRMGLFFAVSGLLAAMTLSLWGPSRQVSQRLRRIAIPLAVAMVTILPLQKLVVFFYYHLDNPGPGRPRFEYTLANIFSLQPHHLWFLSYVLAFNLAAVAFWLLMSRGTRAPAFLDSCFRRFVSSWLMIPGLAVICALPLWLGGEIEAPGDVAKSLVPLPVPFAYYGVFFVFGWMLWRSRDLLTAVEGRPISRLVVAVPSALLAFALYARLITLPERLPIALTILFVSGVAAWATIFAVWGLFARYLPEARPWVRYLADASYWIYLVHLPVLVAFQLSLARTDMPPGARLLIATSASIAVSGVTYALLVRYTAVGNLLHGKRTRPGRIADPAPGVGFSNG